MMRIAGIQNFPPMDRVIFGRAAADAVLDEAQRLDAKRVFLLVSHTLNLRYCSDAGDLIWRTQQPCSCAEARLAEIHNSSAEGGT